MTTAYSPQKHAQAVDANTELLRHAIKELAALRGDVTRLVHALPRGASEPDTALDDLVQAAFDAMGSCTWITAELAARTLRGDVAGHDLARAIAATGKASTRSLGRYLAARVPGAAYLTDSGLELRRITPDGNSLAWTIAKV